MLQLNDVYKVFTTEEVETYALNGVTLTVGDGDFISITGPSGCGKSTLLNVMGLLDSPSRGNVEIDGADVSDLNDRELSRLRNENFGFVFQNFHLIPGLTILQNVELPMLYSRRRHTSAEIRRRSLELLERVDLIPRKNHFPGQLSGGQCQRAAIARAMMNSPRILLADEPTGNLDSHMGREIMDLLHQLNGEGTTVLMVTHDMSLAEEAGIRVLMNDGEIVGVENTREA